VIAGDVNLAGYDTVVWILGEESTEDDTFNATEQEKVEQFLAAGGNLFLSGAEIGWDLDEQDNGRTFYENSLKANYVSDDAGTYAASGSVGSIFEGLTIAFDDGSQSYNVDFPDVISPQPGALTAMNYSGGLGGSAAIQAAGTGGRGSMVMLAFPFETITSPANRAAVIDRVFDYFGLAVLPPPNADFNRDGTIDTIDYVIWRKNNGNAVAPGTAGDADGNGKVDQDDYQIWRTQFGTSPAVDRGASNEHADCASDLLAAFTTEPESSIERSVLARMRTASPRRPRFA
jgi:hypothetical protein